MHHNKHPEGSVAPEVKQRIEAAIPGARVEVEGGRGHYTIRVVSAAFAGKGLLDRQRMVMAAITPLMTGPGAPVHAIDALETREP